jgi:hypothetical protein
LSNSKGNNLHVYHFIIAGDKEKHPCYIVKKIDPNIQWHDKAKEDPDPKVPDSLDQVIGLQSASLQRSIAPAVDESK